VEPAGSGTIGVTNRAARWAQSVVVLNPSATPLLYALPLSAMLGSLILMERARRKLSTSRVQSLIVDPIVQAVAFFFALIPRWRASAAGGRR